MLFPTEVCFHDLSPVLAQRNTIDILVQPKISNMFASRNSLDLKTTSAEVKMANILLDHNLALSVADILIFEKNPTCHPFDVFMNFEITIFHILESIKLILLRFGTHIALTSKYFNFWKSPIWPPIMQFS